MPGKQWYLGASVILKHSMKTPKPVTLQNDHVTLRPLSPGQAEEFLNIGSDEDIWTYLTPEPFRTIADAENWIAAMQQRSAQHGDVPFAVYDRMTGRLAGSSSFLEVRVPHGGLEIGFTWYGKDFRRTHVNTAAKLALFSHAFDDLGAHRVQLQTDARNIRSQNAIARLGAVKEGVLRKHKVYPDGFVRDSVMFSVTIGEWPGVKTRLQQYLR